MQLWMPGAGGDLLMPEATLESALEQAVAAIERCDPRACEAALARQFSACMTQPDAFLDAGYLLGMLTFIGGARDKGIGLIKGCVGEDRFSPRFSYYFGRMLGALGDDGETLRKGLQLMRLIPMQTVGYLGIEKHFTEVEPWYFSRTMTQFFPRHPDEFKDAESLVEKYVLPGWTPPQPPFKRESKLLTLGSCFAQELRNYLAEHGMAADWLFVPPGLNNTFALRNFVSWCLTGETSTAAYWYDEGATGGAVKWGNDAGHESYAEVFKRIDGVILTVGLAEVWWDTVSGGVFWRGVPKSLYDESRHVCRVSTVEENEANLQEIIRLIRQFKPDIPIILTLSPVPLKATTGDKSCIAMDTVSKSILRVAIDKVVTAHAGSVHYWPSFEIVRSLSPHLPYEMFGEDGNTRHVNRAAVHLILRAFMKHYFAA
jgi:GSCFA family